MWVFSKYRMAQLSAVLNFLGAILVFLAFQATSSDFFLTTLKSGNKALCVGTNALVVWTPSARVGFGMPNGCAEAESTPRVAVVTIESPKLSFLGWVLLLFGFFLQIFSIEPPKPIEPLTPRSGKINPHTRLPHSEPKV